MIVLTTPRRITLYWLLLLLPTLAVGTAALVLLRREQQRLEERSAYADQARRTAAAARARLIVENVELLIGDVQTGLVDGLAGEPSIPLDVYLDQLERTNPLVRMTFRATEDGRVLRPDARTTNDDERGFLRRFPLHFGQPPPWSRSPAAQMKLADLREQNRVLDELQVRQSVNMNVAQAQSARRDVQELLKSSQTMSNAPPATEGAQEKRFADSIAGRVAKSESGQAQAERNAGARRTQPTAAAPAAVTKAKTAYGPVPAAKAVEPDRSGWVPAVLNGRQFLFGWVQPGGRGEVRGVEVNVAALVQKLAGTLPAEVSAGEGYALRDNQGRVLHQAGAVLGAGSKLRSDSTQLPSPAVRVPLSATMLPGWEVVAFLTPTYSKSVNGMEFFWTSAVLVALFVAAILVGGWLLAWQARRSEAEAAQKTSFVANVSHEFKTPLTTIRLYSELLEQGRVRDANQGAEYLRTIGRETQRLARLVNNALDFSRLEQGRKKYARERIDLVVELGRLLDTHAPRVGEAGLHLERELPAEALPVATDRDAFEQIVLNVIDNACKYAAEGGELKVILRARAAGGAEVVVADRGPGVPEEHRELIFEKFHRVDDALTAEKSGAGLGLSIARQLARGLGGDLSHAPRTGGGSEFILLLP